MHSPLAWHWDVQVLHPCNRGTPGNAISISSITVMRGWVQVRPELDCLIAPTNASEDLLMLIGRFTWRFCTIFQRLSNPRQALASNASGVRGNKIIDWGCGVSGKRHEIRSISISLLLFLHSFQLIIEISLSYVVAYTQQQHLRCIVFGIISLMAINRLVVKQDEFDLHCRFHFLFLF